MISLVGNNLTARYGGVDLIKNITLEVKQGEIAVIVGPNGAGKSTAMKALLGMLKLTDGSVNFAALSHRGKHSLPSLFLLATSPPPTSGE